MGLLQLLLLPLLGAALADQLPPDHLKYTVDKLKIDLDNIREEMKSRMSCNEQRNSQLTLEWAMEAVSELRREMREVEAASNSSSWQQELRNEVSVILAEAEGVTKLAAADGARLAAGEARHAELMLDVRQVRELATATKQACDDLRQDIRKTQVDWKSSMKSLHKEIYHLNSDNNVVTTHESSNERKHNYRKLRHVHSLHKQIDELKDMYQNLFTEHKETKYLVKQLYKKMEWMEKSNSVTDESKKLDELAESQKSNAIAIHNITMEVGTFNKLHISMLELLENMETLETKVEKTIPDFQKEISKLDVDMIQMKSQNQYMKEDHENVHQTMKAIAVSVSNLVDKVENDRTDLYNLNKTTVDLDQRLNRLTPNRIEVPSFLNEFQDVRNVQRRFKKIAHRPPSSCVDVEGSQDNYMIAPSHNVSVSTSCEDGWTLVQRRINGTEDFNRNYQEYAAGFGSPSGEYWIGNEALHHLTSNNCTSLRIDMLDKDGQYWGAMYDYFHVDSEGQGYRLKVDGYTGNSSNALDYQNGMEFSTIDKDRDTSRNNCAKNYEGGWWFSHCQHVNLNGNYMPGLTWFNSEQNRLIPLASTKMMLRNNAKCNKP